MRTPVKPQPAVAGDRPAPETVGNLLRARIGDDHVALRFEDQAWTWDAHVRESAARSAWLHDQRRPGPFHIGVLLDNVPDFSFLLGAAALGGAVIVGINPTRRGDDLTRDIRRADCQLLVTQGKYLELLDGLDLPFDADRIIDIDDPTHAAALDTYRNRPLPDGPTPDLGDLLMLIFTSGTSGEPKAVRVTHRKISGPGTLAVQAGSMRRDDVVYLSMPMFHSACVLAAWSPALVSGATMVLRPKFSASGFLPDVRRYGVTYFHYVGKPLAYILATPARADDHDNPLRLVSGNEAADVDIERFAARFDCRVSDGFGSTEGGVIIGRTPDTPTGSLGLLRQGTEILHPDTDLPTVPGVFDENGRLLNMDEAIGELVNTNGAGNFDGYYNDQAATDERLRDGMYRSGDLAYRDDQGYVYFAGRTIEWLRVDGENFAAAPVERVISRYPAVSQVAVYAVPAPDVGDDVMVTLKVHDAAPFDPDDFLAFLRGQSDLGTKWLPTYLRIARDLPETQTNKVVKRILAQEGWHTTDPVWVRDRRTDSGYRPLHDEEVAAIRAAFTARGRGHLLP